MIGKRIGKWLVIENGPVKSGKITWRCRCSCGVEKDVYQCHLRAGKSKGCAMCAKFKHGMCNTPTYASWSAMHERCGDNHESFLRYKGRGISVCEEWKRFEAFFADMGVRPEGCSLDRINGELGYFKENCKWSSAKEQQNNLSSNRRVVWKGESLTVSQLAEKLGINYQTLYARITRGGKLDSIVHAR